MEIFELNQEIKASFRQLDEAISANDLMTVKRVINSLHAHDIADYLEDQKDDIQATLFRLLKKDLAVDVFEDLEFEEQEYLINNLRHERIVEILEEMDPDDRTELFEEMPAKVVSKYLHHLSLPERLVATKLLGYPEYSVGRLMTTEYVAFRPHITVQQAINRLKKIALDKETIYHCFIIDATRKLVGSVTLKNLFLSELDDVLEDIMNKEPYYLSSRMDQEEAAKIFKHYDLLALPVLDSENRMVGMVTFDDLVDILEEEATEDIQKMAAILPEEHPYFDAGILNIYGKRVLWLSVLMTAQIFSSFILKGYEMSMQAVAALAFFVPMLLATGGNTGAQSSAMVIRGLAVGEIKTRNFLSVIWRESAIGLLLGVSMCLLGFGASFFVEHHWVISLVLGISVSLTVVAAAVIGGTLPMIFQALKLDPALMSGPFITTLVDIIGLIIYFETYFLVTKYIS